MEILFTHEQLLNIETEAELNFEMYLGGHVINGQATEISIITISKNKQLIFIEGNEYSGYRHLSARHGFFSFKNYWTTKDENEYKLDNPSKFNPHMMPIIDYVKIADSIYCEENKNVTKNNNPESFDKYSGQFIYSENIAEKFHLLTYKDTKIVHTLFPDKKKHNKKNKSRFGKGIITITFKFPDFFDDLLVPYENEKGISAYSILYRKSLLEKIERIIIQKHDSIGGVCNQFVIAFRNFDEFIRYKTEDMYQLQNRDLSDLEELINKIDDQIK